MSFSPPRERTKRFLNKNKSIKLFKGKQKIRDTYAQKRDKLLKLYDQVDSSKLDRFDCFPLTSETQKGLKKCQYATPTEIQTETVIPALKKRDVLAAAKTGSGKTLAFIIPVLERLFCEGWSKVDGLGALVITPTRELALQIFEVCRNVGSFHGFTMGLVIGGKDLRVERKILDVYNIVICTPGRLLQHMDENPLFSAMNLQILVLDEADRILDMGFEKEINAIIENLPPERQTLLFSATQTRSVKDLARLSLKDPLYVSVHEFSKHATPDSLEQSFIVCELSRKVDFIWSFLKNHKRQKIIVFMATCKQVKFIFDIFCRMKPGISLMALYGGLHQFKRMERYKEFCRKNYAVLFATDIAARGLDFPNVNWVIQLDCPEDANTYIHRAGRTARHLQGGESVLVLLPSEKDSMVKQLQERKIPINEIKVHPSKMAKLQIKMEILCARDVNLKESAQRAFKSYYKSVAMMKDKSVFDVQNLFQQEIREGFSKSLGLAFAPRVRFVDRLTKNKTQRDELEHEARTKEDVEREAHAKEALLDLNASEDSDEDDDFLKPVKSVHIPSSDDEKIADEIAEQQKSKKVVTKAALAKKILKKKIKGASIKFDEVGEAIEDVPKQLKAALANEIAEEMAEQGYDVEKAKKLMDAEDEIDKNLYRQKIKQKHKEKKLKLRAERSLEKPPAQLNTEMADEEDSIYNGNDNEDSVDDENSTDDEIDDNESSDSGGDDYEEEQEQSSTFTNENDFKDSNEMPKKKRKVISLEDEEMLALHFLENS